MHHSRQCQSCQSVKAALVLIVQCMSAVSVSFFLGKLLEKLLEQNALEICGEPDRFRGEKIKIAELQISTQLPSVKEAQLLGHGNSRKDIATFYNKNCKGTVSYTDLFKEVKDRISKISNKGFDPEAKAKFLKRHENLVVISGQPGIGKSTLTKRLVKEMWKSKLYNSDIVFFIQFRAVDYERKSDLLVFLAPFVEECFPYEGERIEILKELHKLDNVYIIMDGFDEALIDFSMNQPKIYNILAENSAAGFVQNLIEGNILPHSKKMLTSRPHAIAQLPEDFQPKVLFTIQGLDEAGLKQICLNICSKNNVRCNKILDYLNSHPDLKSLCHTPVLGIMVMEDLKKNQPDNLQENNQNTITSIFVSVFKRLLEEKQKTRFPLKNIAAFAFEKFRNGEFYFKDYEPREAGVEDQIISTFFNIFLKGTKMLYFVHLMWQEFLVAVHLRLFKTKRELTSVSKEHDEDKQKNIVTKLKSEKYQVVAAFLFGLCNKNTLDNLLDCIEIEKGQNNAGHCEACKVELQNFTIKVLQKQSKSIVSILKWIYENSEQNFVHNAAVCLKGCLRIKGHQILPSDIPIINYFLRTCDVDLKLEVINPRFVGNCYCDFYKELHTTLIQNQKIKVRQSNQYALYSLKVRAFF